jgi:hypothetical protein
MKGILFGMILVFVIILLIMFVSINQLTSSFQSSQRLVENRVNSMLNFYDSIIFDSKKSLDIIGKRAISSAINYITENGSPLSDSNVTITNLMSNGTINGITESLMENATIEDWKNTIEALGEAEGFQTSISIKDILIQPHDSFHLSVSYSISVNLSDIITKANVSKTSRESFLLNIEGFEDPLYPLNTYGRITNVIRKSPHWLNYSNDDPTNLDDDLTNSYYHPSLNGASFLDRLEGKYTVQSKYLSASPVGMESFVDKDEIFYSGLGIQLNATNIDYFYFSGSGVSAYRISGMQDNFRLDDENTIEGKNHLEIYNVTILE